MLKIRQKLFYFSKRARRVIEVIPLIGLFPKDNTSQVWILISPLRGSVISTTSRFQCKGYSLTIAFQISTNVPVVPVLTEGRVLTK